MQFAEVTRPFSQQRVQIRVVTCLFSQQRVPLAKVTRPFFQQRVPLAEVTCLFSRQRVQLAEVTRPFFRRREPLAHFIRATMKRFVMGLMTSASVGWRGRVTGKEGMLAEK